MDASLDERMLRLAQELAISHGTFFAAALLADMNVPMPLALASLSRPCLPVHAATAVQRKPSGSK